MSGALAQAAPAAPVSPFGLQSFAAILIVLGLLFALAWLVRRGPLANLRTRGRAIAVETAMPLGERRSLVIVTVEGRRLLLGLTPGTVSLVTELAPGRPFDEELAKQEAAGRA